ncbi:MAG: 4Fe-4S dicluster domain-containing protein [Lachnospiraceae bacterium]|nr:4Fe-4S dicluster domain-containing protein [Lachnospiraceae bacterium]
MKQFAIVIDLDRCIGCRAGCQVACKMENDIGLGKSRSVLHTITYGKYPDQHMYYIPVMCQQCEDPACVNVCPTGACYKSDEDGVVYIDKEACIGCQSCRKACPYDAENFNKELRVMDKCIICSHLREKDEKPACVSLCPGNAIYFGDVNDPESEVSKLLAANEGHVYSLNNDAGTNPSGRFILRKDEWIDPFKK